ncbi:MAG: hypothetical protein COA96_09700 [SAR86 cluster bacterium]|uniref:Yip1 domain-containing protein n=1 Tax=SAR86 cluster bacterium TaxID=2030880 RepID=A0A2A5AZZ1_9GAMM|nr:MAG: hypothetical protein COA96_09700 [SAR86 cluster bacterium]
MNDRSYSFLLFKSLYQPSIAFEELAKVDPSPFNILIRYSIWLLILPPAFSLIGAANFGWRLGAAEPLMLPTNTLVLVSVAYLCVLIFGLLSTAFISRWMASTYGASTSLGRHVALITIVGEPLAIASVAHLYPDVFVNILILIPTMIWSMYLLYKGIPIVLETPPERGMLMASSLVGWLLVAAVSLLGLSVMLWTLGVGPLLGV